MSVATPTAARLILHPIWSLIQARGVAEKSAPTPPVAMNKPPITTNFRGENHSARSLKLHTKTVETPIPTSTRPRIAKTNEEDMPMRIEPPAATRKKAETVFLGPQESASSPTGSCMRA